MKKTSLVTLWKTKKIFLKATLLILSETQKIKLLMYRSKRCILRTTLLRSLLLMVISQNVLPKKWRKTKMTNSVTKRKNLSSIWYKQMAMVRRICLSYQVTKTIVTFKLNKILNKWTLIGSSVRSIKFRSRYNKIGKVATTTPKITLLLLETSINSNK